MVGYVWVLENPLVIHFDEQDLSIDFQDIFGTTKKQHPVGVARIYNYSLLKFSRWWFQTFFIFTPTWGRFPILTNIFQLGWNHQLVFTLSSHFQTTWVFSHRGLVYWSKDCSVPQFHRHVFFFHDCCWVLLGEFVSKRAAGSLIMASSKIRVFSAPQEWWFLILFNATPHFRPKTQYWKKWFLPSLQADNKHATNMQDLILEGGAKTFFTNTFPTRIGKISLWTWGKHHDLHFSWPRTLYTKKHVTCSVCLPIILDGWRF